MFEHVWFKEVVILGTYKCTRPRLSETDLATSYSRIDQPHDFKDRIREENKVQVGALTQKRCRLAFNAITQLWYDTYQRARLEIVNCTYIMKYSKL